jgi:hypothetical protein
MQIKSHVGDDVRKGMIVQSILNVLLKSIYSPFCKLHEMGNASHHIWRKKFLHQLQVGLEGEQTIIISAYHLQ